jgi:hypothetical protein
VRQDRIIKHLIQMLLLLVGSLLGGEIGAAQEGPNLSFVVPRDGQTIGGPNVLVWVAEEEPCGAAAIVFETSSGGNSFKPYRSEENPNPGQCSHMITLDTTVFPAGQLLLMARPKNDRSGPIVEIFVRHPPVADCKKPTPVFGNPFVFRFNCTNSRVNEGRIVSYQWDFGDGDTSETVEPAITHRYAILGTHIIEVTIVDDLGLSSTSIIPLIVGKE